MHNKSFTADKQATIIGGRNIGDEYFGARTGHLFADLDILAIGPAANEMQQDFERYWQSRSAYPARTILRHTTPISTEALVARVDEIERSPAASAYVKVIRELPFLNEVVEGRLPFEWVPVHMISDDPAKALRPLKGLESLTGKLFAILAQPKTSISLVSSYFVPTRTGTDVFARLARSGIRVSILTNSFAATDVALVHAGYAHRRKPLLKAGVRLFELCGREPLGGGRARNNWSILGSQTKGDKPLKGGLGTQHGARPALRSSASVLHAKIFAVDRQRIFVGSFNFDPRSLHLNTELGFIIESPRLAGKVQDMFEHHIDQTAYCLKLSANNRIRWLDKRQPQIVRYRTEPETTWFGRMAIRVISHLPIEWML